MSSSSRSRTRPAAALLECSGSKRRRRTATHAVVADARDSSSWASLAEDVVSLIGHRVLAAGDVRDYICFRAACHHWRSSTASPHGRGVSGRRFHPRRWMMLPEGQGKLRGHVRFFNLSTGAVVRLKLPFFRDHRVLDSVDGIVLQRRDSDTAVRLLHPFTGDIADFPPLDTLLPYTSRSEHLRDVAAASISLTTSDDQTTVSLMIWLSRASPSPAIRGGGCRAGPFYTPLPHKGKLYVLDKAAAYGEPEVLEIDAPWLPEGEEAELSLPPPKPIAKCPARTPDAFFLYYLVNVTLKFLLADLILGITVPVKCIGYNSIFLGDRNLCVSSKVFPAIVGDSIVFYHQKENYLAQYHLRSGTLSPTSDGCIFATNMPSPSSIIHHIYTCCFRTQWNKGHLMFQREIRAWQRKRN
uniref:KIB1-4 beta-propeller domain-containing protein n=1 Tax=Oryza punctata TaxID=4537 RepID=A0A0E0MKZ0_ORYPU